MSETSGFVFGVDLDGVVGDFYGAMRPIVAEWQGVKPGSLSSTNFSYGLSEWGVPNDERSYLRIHHFAVTQRQLFEHMPVIPGAAAALRRLSAAGVRIRIITHRLFIPNFHQAAVQQTVRWLDHHGIPYWDLCFMGQKSAVGADLYIDDTPRNVADLRAAGKPTICFANPTNRHITKPRLRSWEQVEAFARRTMQAWLRQRGDDGGRGRAVRRRAQDQDLPSL